MKSRRWAAVLATVGLLFVGRTAAAEYLKTDCGPAMSLQRNAPWASGGGCATNLRMSYGMGQWSSPPTSLVQSWFIPFTSPPRRPAIMADDTIVLAAGTKLYAFAKSGVKRWEVELGQTMTEAPAIGADGTIYIGAANGNLFARNSNGTAKWTYTNSAIGQVTTSVAVGLGGRLYVGGSGGRVAAVNPNGTLAWIATVTGTPFGDMALSHDGEYLYVSTASGFLYAINTATGLTLWSKTLGTNAAVTSMVVNRWGVLITASFDGKLTAYMAGNGQQIAQRTFPTARFKQIALDQRGMIYALAGYPNEAGQVSKLHVLYQDVFFTEAPGFSAWDFMPSNVAALQAGLVIDANGMVWGNFRSSELVSVNRGGFQQFSYAIPGSVPAFNTIVMNNDGTLVFTSGNNLFSRGPGRGSTNDLLNYVSEPRKVPLALGSPVDPIKECVASGTGPSGAMRPGFTWTTSNNRMATLGFSGVNDPGCPISFCTDNEVSFTNANGAWTKLINPSADLNNPTVSLPSEYRQLPCPEVPVTKPCTAVNPSGIRWNQACLVNSECLTSEVCAAVCPNNGSGQPQDQCDQDSIIKRCADLDEQRCLATLPAEAQCHEVRECGEAEDRLNVTESTPTCDNGQSCNVTKTIGPASATSLTAAYPAMETWDTAEPACKLVQLENAKKVDTGGKNSNSGRTNKDWGVFMGATSNFDFDLKPLPFGFVMPKATGLARFDAVAKVMGKEFGVLMAQGTAQAVDCKFQAKLDTKLFGQAIDALNWAYGDDGTSTTSKCKQFFSELDAATGTVKTLLMRANRIEAYLKEAQANGYAPAVTRRMCENAFGFGTNSICNQPYTAANAKAVADFYIQEYRNQVGNMLPNGSAFNTVKQTLIQHLTNLVNNLGVGASVNQQTGAIQWTRELVNLAQPFNVLGAVTQFPIGPLLLTLEVNGQGEWGIKGFVELGVGFMPPNPGVAAGAVAEPFAHVDVDVYLGVGFGISGLASLTVGFGGELTLVDVRTPLRGSLFLGASTTDSQFPSRTWPNAFRRFNGRTPIIPAKQYSWGTSAKLNAAVVLTVLSGKLDMRVRIRFTFISKTWKKIIAEWAGKTWDFDWAGSFGVPIDMPALTLPVLDSIPFPNISTSDITTALFGSIPPGTAWPTLAGLPTGIGRTRADILENTPSTCQAILQ